MNAELEPIGARGTSGAALERISEAIRQGEFMPGDRLPSERVLAQQLQVSRQTVRKAIQALVEAGVVEVLSGQGARSGARVRSNFVPLDVDRATMPMPNVGDVADVLEARRMFEPRVAVLAGFLMTNEDYDRIAEVLELQRAATTLHGIRQLDIRFHLAIAQAAHNQTIVEVMHTMMRRLDIARHVVTLDEADEACATIDIHERTLAALASRDQSRIEATMDEHLRMMEVAWERATGRALPRAVPSFLLRPPEAEPLGL
jgi:GntR family transcriptional repressor for pyruvate dehydrogenase complex